MITARHVDHSAIRVNQVATIALLAIAFVLDLPALAALQGAVMLISAAYPPAAVYTRLYQRVLRPARLVRPDVHPDNPEPHRFAQTVGGVCVVGGVLIHALGAGWAGWALALLVIGLASLNLFAGWCAGCTLYYWLNRLGVPGFDRAPVEVRR